MTPTGQDKELSEKLRVMIRGYLRNYTDIARDSSVYADEVLALITADRKRVALEARIELIDNMLNSSPAILHDCGRRLGGVFGKTYLEHKKSELKAQQEEVK